MKRLGWLTDIHLDFLKAPEVEAFARKVSNPDLHGLLLTGDISVAPKLGEHLGALAGAFEGPIYFVLGNHDYYGASIASVRRAMSALSEQVPRLRWLPALGIVPLSDSTALIGIDGWGDFQAGATAETQVQMSDFKWIEELRETDDIPEMLVELGRREAEALRPVLESAATRYERVIIATHVPPFEEACLFHGGPCHPHIMPYLVCTAVGECIREVAGRHGDVAFEVFAGHTHGEADVQIAPNLRVRVSAAEYRAPELADILTVT